MKTGMKLIRRPAAAVILGAALGFALPAIGLANDATATASVQVSDLNLATKGGQNALERRTSNAIKEVCPDSGSAAASRATTNAAHRECARAVRASMKQQLGERSGRAVAGRG